MLTACELAQLRADMLDLLPDTATILRMTGASDGEGGQTNTYASVGTASCRLLPNRGRNREALEAQRPIAETTYLCHLPYGTDVRPSDRLAVNGVTYEVGPHDGGKSQPVFLVLELRRVQ